ncbi:hypothetical protein J4E89_009395 [Alternaria sp. Ai002NY15]|nr:hypothetical protein J4E89_009395 [Alternaria sp. Ai002NY15]
MRFTPPQPLATGDSAPPSAPNRLLALPRELRDHIYEYALTEDEGLLLFERHRINDTDLKSFKGCRPSEPGVESNQLKYACRQLYQETKGLGLGLNDLAMDPTLGTKGFVAFLDTCSARQQQCIRKVTLSDGFLRGNKYKYSWDGAMYTLEPLCASHPWIMIHLYVFSLSYIDSATYWIITAGNILYKRYLHTDHAVIPPSLRSVTVPVNPHMRNQLPKNLRVFPGRGPGHALHSEFDEEFVQAFGEEHRKICTRELEKWQREGI